MIVEVVYDFEEFKQLVGNSKLHYETLVKRLGFGEVLVSLVIYGLANGRIIKYVDEKRLSIFDDDVKSDSYNAFVALENAVKKTLESFEAFARSNGATPGRFEVV